jgi:hypothetical protein
VDEKRSYRTFAGRVIPGGVSFRNRHLNEAAGTISSSPTKKLWKSPLAAVFLLDTPNINLLNNAYPRLTTAE